MKNALVFGGASKNSLVLIDTLLTKNYHVINVGSSMYDNKNVKNIYIDWNKIDLKFVNKKIIPDHPIDFVFFNQNSSSLSQKNFRVTGDDILEQWKLIKDWQNSLWLSCQLSYLVIHSLGKKLTNDSKIGWMLSSNIDFNKSKVEEYPDYSAFKFFNYLSMKCFAEQNHFNTFGIMPDFSEENSKDTFKHIILDVLNTDCLNAKIYKF